MTLFRYTDVPCPTCNAGVGEACTPLEVDIKAASAAGGVGVVFVHQGRISAYYDASGR